MQPDFFIGNRAHFCQQLKPNSFVAMASFARMQGDNDEAAPFHQEANFWYLTGIEEADWRLIVDTDSGEQWLVAPQRSFARQMFDGGLTADEATRISGVKNIIDKQEGAALLKRLSAQKKLAYTVKPQNLRTFAMVPNQAPARLLRQLRGIQVEDGRLMLARLRAIKQPCEINAMQSAINITLDGFEKLLPELNHMRYEYEVDAKLTYEFRRRGAVHGFSPIIASGNNTYVLHHPLPKDPIAPNDWLLMDIGAKVQGYSADVTRTLPIGQPSKRHLEVYEAVRRMHAYAFGMLRPGLPAKEYFTKSYQYVGEELKRLGLIKEIKLDYTSVFKYMPHAIGHGLGVDVHDPLGRPEKLLENMTLTVEVGVYIPEEGIGVRLEDDVIITNAGARNMSQRLPIDLVTLQTMLY